MRLMRLLGVALAWALGVGLVASVSWVAINSAGRQVVEDTVVTRAVDGGSSVADAVMPTSSATSSPTPTAPTGTPTGRGATGGPTMGSKANPGATVTPSNPNPGTGSSSRPSTSTTTPAPPPPPTSQGLVLRADTQNTAGGYVWVECAGTRINNAFAMPNEGWSTRTGQHSPGDLEVKFTRSTTQIEVVATCPSGRPHFEVKTSRDDHDDDHDDD